MKLYPIRDGDELISYANLTAEYAAQMRQRALRVLGAQEVAAETAEARQ